METTDARHVKPLHAADTVYSGSWAVCLPVTSVHALGPLRLTPNLSVLPRESELWLQGNAWSSDLEVRVLEIPDAVRYRLETNGLLTRFERRVPEAQIPDGIWIPLPQYLSVSVSQAAVSLVKTKPISWRLERSVAGHAPNVWLGRRADLIPYVEAAAGVRLSALRFAFATDGRVVACGFPLPPLPGTQYFEREGIAVPLGWETRPLATPSFWRKVFSAESADLILLEPDGTFERILSTQFIAGSRSALRASLERPAP